MISPTPGRVVWFTPITLANMATPYQYDQRQPLAAMVAYVHHDRMINVVFFDQHGDSHSATSVPLLQDDDLKPEQGYFACWMPYQKGQAAKHEKDAYPLK